MTNTEMFIYCLEEKIESRYWPFDRDFSLYNLLKNYNEDEKLPIL